jgi:hypothetical protein
LDVNCIEVKEFHMGTAELNVCGLTNHRDLKTINQFIDTCVGREASKDRSDEELMMEPLWSDDHLQSGQRFGEDMAWEPALTLSPKWAQDAPTLQAWGGMRPRRATDNRRQ